MSRTKPETENGVTWVGWSCDEEGCEAVLKPRGPFSQADWEKSGWYKCSSGMFVHRCPEHAGPWRKYDELMYERSRRFDNAWAETYRKFEDEFERNFEASDPPPPMPSKLYGNNEDL